MLDKLTSDDFAACQGQAFLLFPGADEAPVEVDLVAVTVLGDGAPPGYQTRRAPFSLVFRARSNRPLPQQIYALEHPAIGRLELFLVPIGPDRVGMRFEAVFS